MAASDNLAVLSSTTDISSGSTVSDDWQDLTKSDYAKVIFSDLMCNVASGTVECKFQITDNVHEDPNDYVGLFRIGYEDLSQCLVSKMLSQTKCEDDGKLQRCVFTFNELPCLTDGFYQFLYVTRDQEVCGASMPFQIKIPSQSKESSVDSSASESMDGGFLLVSNETERKVETIEQEKTTLQQSALSEEKKEEIAAWVSQNPDYLLVAQIREQTFTIDALQQSKDLAMREVSQLYAILDTQNGELIQLRNMLAAYEEKIKMSQSLQDEKNNELTQLKNLLDVSRRKMHSLEEEKNNELTQLKNLSDFYQRKVYSLVEERNVMIPSMRKSLTEYEENVKSLELLLEEKEEDLKFLRRECQRQEGTIKEGYSIQNKQQEEIDNLKKELEEMKEMQKAKECQQVNAEGKRHSLDSLIQKAQDLVHIVSDSSNLDFSNENVEKLYQLKIQLLIAMRQVSFACDPTGVKEEINSATEKDVNEIGQTASTSSAPQKAESVETVAVSTSAAEMGKADILTSSPATTSLPSSTEKEPAKEDASKEVSQRSSLNKTFESDVLEHQIVELPRLDVISEDIAKILQTSKSLDAEDISVVNRLTEKIMNRGFNLYEAIELVDDSVSDSESEASEISECSSSIKKDILCVSRVMEALYSYLSKQTSLDHLIMVEKDEDKSLIHRNKWDVLLQKCALRYQIELLLEHIEKQKEGIKKVSEKICDLLTKYMLLKDEMAATNDLCERLESVIARRETHISKLEKELNFQNTLIGHFRSKNEELESKTELAEKTVEDFRARIQEASDLYRKQYTEIARLSKKLRKYKSVKDKTKSSKAESSLISSDSSNAASSFEVVKEVPVQNINDSDTGEHMFEKASLVSKEKTLLQVDSNTELKTVPEKCLSLPASSSGDVLPSNSELKSEESVAQVVGGESNAETVECRSQETASHFSDFASYEHFQEVIKERFVNLKGDTASRNSQECSISCYMCKEIIRLGAETPVDLMNHLENEHSMKTCPVCGHLFEMAIPQRYFQIHVEQHFETQ